MNDNISVFNVKPQSLINNCHKPQLYNTNMITIHTEDRDVTKYPQENTFEIVLPSIIKNAISIELFDIYLPLFYYNISEYLQNNKFFLSIPLYFHEQIEVVIPSGYYSYIELANEITKQLNDITSDKLFNLGVYYNNTTKYTNFDVSFNHNKKTFSFINVNDRFYLSFDKESDYDRSIFNASKMLQDWGIGYNLGFYKKTYESQLNSKSNYYYVESFKIATLDTNNTIYMEISTYNWIDEIIPFSTSTSDYYNNDYNGNVNNSFAKLSLSNVTNNFTPVNKFIRILPHMEEKISRLKFKFRYHNGIPVDFLSQPFNFTLKIETKYNCI